MVTVKGAARRDQARQTRSRIICAAHGEFLEKGYHGATIAAIAERAGVATQTIYFVFHTKAALISAVIDNAVLGEDNPTSPADTDWWAQMQSAPTAHAALVTFIRGAGPLYARAAGISEVLRAAALTDDEVRATYRHHDQMQSAGYRQVIDILAAKGALRTGLDPATATDVLLTTCGDSTYLLLTSARHWSHDQVIDWLCQAVPLLLLDDTNGEAPVQPGA